MKVTMHDINKRLKRLTESSYDRIDVSHFITACNKANVYKQPLQLIFCIEQAAKSNKVPVQIESVIDCFESLCEVGNVGQISRMGFYIAEEVIPKVRDAKDAQTNLRRKLARLKTKASTKINNNISDMLDTGANILDTAKKNFKKNTAHLHKPNQKPDPKKNAAIEEACTYILNKAAVYVECDRVLENYNILSKRFNLERIFEENIRINGVEDTIYEICRLADTYPSNNETKLRTVIECSYYGMRTRGIPFTEDQIRRPAINYFCMKAHGYETCQRVLEATVFCNLEPNAIQPGIMQILMEEDPEIKKEFAHGLTRLEEQMIGITSKDTSKSKIFDLHESIDFNKIFADFKAKDDEHKESEVKQLIDKLYTQNVDNITDGTPKLLNWLRQIIVIGGGFAINPIFGAIVAIADHFIRLHKSRIEIEKMIKCFDNEITTTKKKIESTKSKETKDNLEKYLDELEDAKAKINQHYENMLSDAELDKRYDDESEKTDSFAGIIDDDDDTNKKKKNVEKDIFDLDDWDDDDDWGDINLDEAIKIIPKIARYSAKLQSVSEGSYLNNPTSEDFAYLFDSCDLDSVMKFSAMNPNICDPKFISGSINNYKEHYLQEATGYDRYKKINMLESAMRAADTKPVVANDIFQIAGIMKEQINGLMAINTMVECHQMMRNNTLLEASFMNSLKLAGEKLKKAITNLSDKEKTMSKNIDVSMSNMQKSVERSFTTDNREAVIKGSILPSASKVIKMAISVGALWLVQPAIAVIGVLGYIGTSSKYKYKERLMVLDEIEIELKMCQKYIDIAESKNDMKSLKRLLNIQRDLERQHQRIKFNMKDKFNQKTYETNSDDM